MLAAAMVVASTAASAADLHLRATAPPRPERNHSVTALAVAENTIYVGGGFRTLGGAPRLKLAAFDAITGELKPWAPSVTGDGEVDDIAVSRGTVYVSGRFQFVNGVPRLGLAALDARTGELKRWDPLLRGRGEDGQWCSVLPCPLAVAAEKVYVSGDFVQGGFVAIDARDASRKDWSARVNGDVVSVAVAGNRVYLAGFFNRVGGRSWWTDPAGSNQGLVALDRRNLKLTNWNPRPDDAVRTLKAFGAVLYVGGDFERIAGKRRLNIAAFRTTTGRLTPWRPSLTNPSQQDYSGVADRGIARSGSVVYVGGTFERVNSHRRWHLAALDARTGARLPWPGRVTGRGLVEAIIVSRNAVYVGGHFDQMLSAFPFARRT